MTEQEFADRAEAIKARLYRTARLYLGSEAHGIVIALPVEDAIGLEG